MTSSNFDRHMATMENEHYWRLYLFLNEGVSFLSRGIILRKLDVLGQDLSSLLRENENQIKKTDNLDSSDLDILFPVDGETNMDKWNANMYLCVILALFRASLKPKERTKLSAAKHVLEDLYKRQDDTKIDNLTYKEHVKNLEEAFLVLSFNEDSTMKIVEIKKIYIDEPLNPERLQNKIAKVEFPGRIKQKLIHFLETIYSTYTRQNSCDDNRFGTLKKTRNSGAVVNNSIKDNNAAVGSDETDDCAINDDLENASDQIGACATNDDSENSSDGIGTVVISRDVENEIDMADFEKYVKKEDLKTFIPQELNAWKNPHLNIAVIGRTGVGKSRLINAIRGCKEGDPEYAQIDVTEATMSVEKYPDPKNSVVYWELPGIGSDNFPKWTYIKMKEINFFVYDLYLIVCAGRFTEDEEYLAKTLEDAGKTFLFVQTKADVNEEEFQDFKSVLEKIRKHCVESLSSRKIQAKDIYLISSIKVDHELLEFDRLVERLVYSLSDLKKEVFLNSLRFYIKTLIKEKRTQMISRAKKVCMVSVAVGALPIPGLSLYVDCKLIQNELDVYRQTLLITENDLENLAEKTGIAVDELKSKYNLKSFTLFKDRGFTYFLAEAVNFNEIAEATAKLIPLVGAGMLGYTTYKFLTSTLEILVQDAETMLDILLEKNGSSIFQTN